ncbi:alternative dihydrofolate reductase 2 /dihydropteroate synthase [Hydrogenimonas sp.]|nr:alternative dihydrofolate reductase 2 /dihydropteroate synthase [Hydrogenimonas sp.]
MDIYRIDAPEDAAVFLRRIGCDRGGVFIMAKKMDTMLFAVKGLSACAANILKQDAISVGADLALPKGAVCCDKESYDGVLMGTRRQIEALIEKEKLQPPVLKRLAVKLTGFMRSFEKSVKIMGVINANDDSFYPASRFRESAAVAAIWKQVQEGADIIDIGAVSSRPGSEPVAPDEELLRLVPIVDAIKREGLLSRVEFSIDSYTPEVVAYALENGFSIVNDITGLRDESIGLLAKEFGAKLVIMHMQGTPQTMQENPSYENVILDIDRFFEERVERALGIGLDERELILDVGIGFGKRLEHNLMLLKNLSHFGRFGCELMVGASRKSMIDRISPAPVEKRLPGTLAIHLQALRRGASIVRCHDVAEHRQAIAVYEAIEKGDIL